MTEHSGVEIKRVPFVRNAWYCAAWVDEVTDELLGRKLLPRSLP